MIEDEEEKKFALLPCYCEERAGQREETTKQSLRLQAGDMRHYPLKYIVLIALQAQRLLHFGRLSAGYPHNDVVESFVRLFAKRLLPNKRTNSVMIL